MATFRFRMVSQKCIQMALEGHLLILGINIPKRMQNATAAHYGALAAIIHRKKVSTTVLRVAFSPSPPNRCHRAQLPQKVAKIAMSHTYNATAFCRPVRA